jgi:iron complex outermembrane receptor protein
MHLYFRLWTLGVLLVGPALYASPQADNQSPDALDEIPLEQLAQVPVEFVTGASKYEQNIRRAPASVTVLTSADISNYGWRTLSDALRSAPGFHIRSDRFYDYIGNRGFTRPFDFNSRTLILINGHRMNDSIYQAGAVGSEFILDLEMIDRIEIIRGPSSSLYGSSAFYGAINIIPKKGRELGGGEASVFVSSEPGAKARFSLGNRTASGVEYTISATEWWSRGEDSYDLPQSWRDATLLPDTEASGRDGMHHRSIYANAMWKGFETEAAYVRREKDVLPPVYFTTPDEAAYGIDERAYWLGRITGQPTESATFTANLSLDYYCYEGQFSPAFTNFETQRPYAKSVSLNYEMRWQQELATRHMLIAGLEYQENFIQNLGRDNLTTNTSIVRVRESSSYVSPFAQVDWNLGHGLWLSTGGRFDAYSTAEDRFTPRFGLIWEATPSTTLKLLYGQSFRVPNVEERYSAEAGIVPNPDLGPESNESWEFLVDHKFNSVWQVDGHIYRTEASDLIQAVQISSAPDIFTNQNSQKIVTEGVEVGAMAYFPSNVQLRASATRQRAYDTSTEDIVVDAPQTLLKINASAPLSERWLRLSGELQYVDDRKDTTGARLDDYFTVNLTLRAIQVWHRWDFSLSVYNLFGEEWDDATNSGQIESPPRSVIIRAALDF